MRPISDWADRKYKPHDSVAHLVPFGQPYALCGGGPLNFMDAWYGTGCWDEIEVAAELPLCDLCTTAANPLPQES